MIPKTILKMNSEANSLKGLNQIYKVYFILLSEDISHRKTFFLQILSLVLTFCFPLAEPHIPRCIIGYFTFSLTLHNCLKEFWSVSLKISKSSDGVQKQIANLTKAFNHTQLEALKRKQEKERRKKLQRDH